MHACLERMQELKLGQIRGFGGKLGTSLEEAFGVVSAGDAQALSVEQLARHLGGEAASARCALWLCCGPWQAAWRTCVRAEASAVAMHAAAPACAVRAGHFSARPAGSTNPFWPAGLQGAPGMAHEHGATPLPS